MSSRDRRAIARKEKGHTANRPAALRQTNSSDGTTPSRHPQRGLPEQLLDQVRTFGAVIELAALDAMPDLRDDLRTRIPKWWPYVELARAIPGSRFVVIGGKPWRDGAVSVYAQDADHALLGIHAVHGRLDEFGGMTHWSFFTSEPFQQAAATALAEFAPVEGRA